MRIIKLMTLVPIVGLLGLAVACGDEADGVVDVDIDSGAGDDDDDDVEPVDSGLDDDVDPVDGGNADDSVDGGLTPDDDGGALPDGGPMNSVSDVVSNNVELEELSAALETAGLDDVLDGNGPFTLFAPSDDAFAALPDKLISGLTQAELLALLNHHVIPQSLPSSELQTGDLETVGLGEVSVVVDGEVIVLNGLTLVVTANIEADNGIIHVIDSVMMPGSFPGSVPEFLHSYPRLSEMSAAVDESGSLVGDNLTVFVPLNPAFDGVTLPEGEELSERLTYHSALGSQTASELAEERTLQMATGGFSTVSMDQDTLQIGDGDTQAAVVAQDIMVATGDEGSVVHLVDAVLTQPPPLLEVLAELGLTELGTLLESETVPGETETFSSRFEGAGPFTVFAPANSAFESFPEAGFGAVTLPSVLGAHVVEGAFDSADVAAAIADPQARPETWTSDSDNTLTFSQTGDHVFVGTVSRLTMTDVVAANGIVHVIDGIIVPSGIEFPGTALQLIGAYERLSALSTAVSNVGGSVGTALNGSGPLTLFAPYNEALDGITPTTNTLLYHIVSGSVLDSAVIAEYQTPTNVSTAYGTAQITIDGSAFTVNDANIVQRDIRVSNGIVHILDAILTPPAP